MKWRAPAVTWLASRLPDTIRSLHMAAAKSALLSCQRNAYLREGTSLVLACEQIPDKNSYSVILDDSVLYPEGGGQPYDLGSVNGITVLRVSKAAATAGVEVELPSPVEVGATVKCVVDWERRYDFMQQHTAQHLFSAVAYRLFKADTVGWALGTDSVTVDLSSTPLLTFDQLGQIEEEVNHCIRLGKHVGWKLCSKEEIAADESLRGMVKGAALEMDELRLVSIDGVDLNPCGGTHVQSLSEINVLKVLGLEKDRNAIRARFVAGHRALKYFSNCIQRESILSSKLSSPPSDHVAILDKLLRDKKDQAKRLEAYADELADFWGQSLVASLPTGPAAVVRHREGANLKFLLRAGAKAQEARPGVVILLSGEDEAAPASKAGAATTGPFVLFGEANVVNKSKQAILDLLEARGGGKPGRLQGFANKLDKLAGADPILQAQLSAQA